MIEVPIYTKTARSIDDDGTVASQDPNVNSLNYTRGFVRDFAPSALVFLMQGNTEILCNFLATTLVLQSHDKGMDYFQPGLGLMPAIFKVIHEEGEEQLEADFGEAAMYDDKPLYVYVRVPPVDSCLW